MEITLFWIACGMIAYALLLKGIFEKEAWLNNRGMVIFLHVLFMGAVGALIGFVVSASVDLHGPSPRWPAIFFCVGAAWGLFQSTRKFPRGERPSQLLVGDLDLLETSYSAVLLAAIIMYAVIQAFKIPSGSMENTLLVGDHLFVNKFIYGIRVPGKDKRFLGWREVKRGDIVVFRSPQTALTDEERDKGVKKDFIKRAVGLPGDVVMVKNKRLYINDILQTEPYVAFKDAMVIPDTHRDMGDEEFQKTWVAGESQHSYIRDNFGPVKVPPDHYFVMGDNRDYSFDGRFWGPLPVRLLKGKAWFVYWPLRRIKVIR